MFDHHIILRWLIITPILEMVDHLTNHHEIVDHHTNHQDESVYYHTDIDDDVDGREGGLD